MKTLKAVAVLSVCVVCVAVATYASGGLYTSGLPMTGGAMAGHITFTPDTTYDIGASGATRPRHIYVADEVRAGASLTLDGSAATASFGTAKDFNWNSWGVIEANNAAIMSLSSGSGFHWSSTTAYSGAKDIRLARAAAGILRVHNSGGSTGAAVQLEEMTAPTTGGGNTARLYAKDNGSGKTQLCALFATGAEQCFATEP